MAQKRTEKQKSIISFFSALAVILVSFVGAVAYFSSNGFEGNQNALADISTIASSSVDIATTTVSSTLSISSSVTLVIPSATMVTALSPQRTAVATPSVPLAVATDTEPEAATATPIVPVAVPVTTVTTQPARAPVLSRGLPYSIGTFGNAFGASDGWSNWWDPISHANGTLTIGASATYNINGTLLDGSYGWTDYTFQAAVDWVKGESFGLVARYTDDKDYTVCDFDEKSVGDVRILLEQVVNGKTMRLAVGDLLNYNQMGGVGINAAIEVQGNQASCAFNGHAISTAVAHTVLDPVQNGQIGFITEDPTNNNTAIIVHSVGVVNGSYNIGKDDVQD